jgi:hypothetical protein
MGSIILNVPAEGEDDNPHSDGNNDNNDSNPNPNGAAEEPIGGSDETVTPPSESVIPNSIPNQFKGSMKLDLGAFFKGWALPSVGFKDSSESTSLIIIVDEPEKDDNDTSWSVPVREWRVPSSGKNSIRPVDPVEKFRNRINTQDKVNSGTRPRIVLRGDDGTSCLNGGGSKYGNDIPRDTTPQSPTCDCCCHDSSSRLRNLFESSNSWDEYQGNAYSQYDNGKDDVNRYGDGGHKEDDSQGHSDDNSPGQSYTYNDDDCDCRCDCRKPFGIAMYD